ncbi:hypothetical protein P7C70_g8783, partial [Phenoliferia sp. Uapishka_3]
MDHNLDPSLLVSPDTDAATAAAIEASLPQTDHHDPHSGDIILGEYRDHSHDHQGPDLQVGEGVDDVGGVGIATVQGVLGALQREAGAYQGAYALDSHLAPPLSPTLSPSIDPGPTSAGPANKKHWSSAEDTTLLSLVEANGPRNWAKIAGMLETGRSGASCCARWCRLAGPKGSGSGESGADGGEGEGEGSKEAVAYKAITKGPRQKWLKWTPAEDANLRELVEAHGPKNWIMISRLMATERSDDSCCGRWTHYLAPKTVRRIGEGGEEEEVPTPKSNSNAANPRWTPLEDQKLKVIKAQNPEASWASIGENMVPKRSAGSCRARWVQHVLGKKDKAGKGKAEEEDSEARDEGIEHASTPASPSTSALPAASAAPSVPLTSTTASHPSAQPSKGAEPDLLVSINAHPPSTSTTDSANLAALASILDPALLGMEIMDDSGGDK